MGYISLAYCQICKKEVKPWCCFDDLPKHEKSSLNTDRLCLAYKIVSSSDILFALVLFFLVLVMIWTVGMHLRYSLNFFLTTGCLLVLAACDVRGIS